MDTHPERPTPPLEDAPLERLLAMLADYADEHQAAEAARERDPRAPDAARSIYDPRR